MGIKFLHTADWQIGAKHAFLGDKAPIAREARRKSAERVVAVANERDVDALILAGDVFEDVDVDPKDVLRVVDILRRSKAPVLVLSGNHDPLVPKGPYDHPAWRDAEPNVRVFRDATPVSIGDAEFLPCPVFRRTSHVDPLESLPDAPPSPRRKIRVGVAHGSLLGAGAAAEDAADDFPIDRAHAERAGLDYLALGHWHRPSAHDVGSIARVFYSGTHEPTSVDEVSKDGARRSGEVLLATIDAPGAKPQVEPIRVATLDWAKETIALRGDADLEAFRKALDSRPEDRRKTDVRAFVLSGVVSPAAAARLADLAALAEARCLYARIDASAVRVLPDSDAWVDALPRGAPQDAARALVAEASGEGEGAEIARRALRLLFEFSERPA
jgi:DNA repair exonuclease SbcCD nuclease subunit